MGGTRGGSYIGIFISRAEKGSQEPGDAGGRAFRLPGRGTHSKLIRYGYGLRIQKITGPRSRASCGVRVREAAGSVEKQGSSPADSRGSIQQASARAAVSPIEDYNLKR